MYEEISRAGLDTPWEILFAQESCNLHVVLEKLSPQEKKPVINYLLTFNVTRSKF